MSLTSFTERLGEVPELRTSCDRAVAILWYVGRDTPATGRTAKEIATVLEEAGYPKQNVSRLAANLASDRRTVKAGSEAFRLRPDVRRALDPLLGPLAGPRMPDGSDSIVPRVIVEGTRRTYIKRIVHQANVAYDHALFDCCAVMLRRLIETLIIEVFESAGIASEIKGADGHFRMLDGLITALNHHHERFHIGRNAKRGLRELKELGDKAAHNRRFNATRADVDRLRADSRTAVEELVHLAGLS